MRVRYLPDDPQNAIVDSYFHYLVVPLGFMLAGGFIFYRLFSGGMGMSAGNSE